MKSKRKQLLISSMVMLLVAMLAVTSTTFAWFSSGYTGEVDDFEFTASTASGIKFSVDAQNWQETIYAADIAKAVASYSGADQAQENALFGTYAESTKVFTGKTFNPLSSSSEAVDTSTGYLKLFSAEYTNNLITTSLASDGYYLFNLYIDNTGSEDKALALTALDVNDKADNDKNTANAVRVAILDQGSVAKTGSTATIRENVCKQDDATKATIFEPNETSHTSEKATLYTLDTTKKLDYYGVKAAVASLTKDSRDFIASTNTTAVEKVTTYGIGTEVAALNGNSITKITVVVWLEGQDVDCENDIAAGGVTVGMSFTAKMKYTLSYDMDLGTQTCSNYTKPVDAKYYTAPVAAVPATKPQVVVPTADDTFTTVGTYELKGWSTVKGDKNAIVTGQMTLTADTTLYAIWEKVYTLTYDLDLGEQTCANYTAPVAANYSVATVAAVPETKPQVVVETAETEGTFTTVGTYELKGWSTVKGDASKIVTGQQTLTANTTLFAIWEKV